MIRYFLYITLALISFANLQANGDLYQAIINVNLKEVESIVKEQEFTQQEKNRYISAANVSVDICKNCTKKLIKSPKDLIGTLLGINVGSIGGILTGFGILCLMGARVRHPRDGGRHLRTVINIGKSGVFLGSSICTAGVHLITKSLSMAEAKNQLKAAEKIRELVENIEVA